MIIRKQPPSHVYPDEWFDIEVNVELSRGQGSSPKAKSATGEVEFVPTLLHAESRLPVQDGSTLASEPPTLRFVLSETPPRRNRKMKCTIKTAKPPRKDKPTSYVIHLSPKPSTDAVPISISPVSTRAINLVNYKIVVSPDNTWNSVWYKDEGGRDKCMTVTAGLFTKENTPVLGQEIPFRLTLYYDSNDHPIRVNKQDILRVIGPDRNVTSTVSGKVTIRFRIEDVSKNHQGQEFRVQVSPSGKAKGFKDVGPGFSQTVSIRSKRNKRQRSGGTTGLPEQQRMPSPTRMKHQGAPLRMGETARPASAAFAGADIPLLREAMKGVIQWTDEVVNGLYPLQWQIIGYAQHPDGSPDYNRPYHNMPNPNPCISRVLSMYSGATRDQLRVILDAIEQASSSPQQTGDSFQSGPSGRREPHEQFGTLPYGGHRGIPVQSATAAPFGPPTLQRRGPSPEIFPRGRAPSPPMQHRQPEHYPMMRPPVESKPPPHAAHMMPPDASQGARLRHEQQERKTTSPEVPRYDSETRESVVAYVLARQFKALRTGERLGFPAFNESKEMLGFYRESNEKVGVGNFIPIAQYPDDFGPMQMMESTEILQEAIASKSQEVYALKDWGSISNLIDHALVYAWSKDIDPIEGNLNHGLGGSGAD